MTTANQLKDYASLLRIRQKAYRRNMLFAAAIFFVALAAMLGFGLLAAQSWISMYLGLALVMALGVTFSTTGARLEALTGNRELLNNLQRIIGQNPEM
jgi:1,4-dihydroxy-2-naphthoate octaprenyltransferase